MKTEFRKTAFICSAPTAWNESQRTLKLTVFILANEFKLYLNQTLTFNFVLFVVCVSVYVWL